MDLDCSSPDMETWENDKVHLEKILLELPQQYEIEGKMSEGAMGSIFKAQNRYTNAAVAIKLMHFESTRNAEAIKRFYFEAKAASLLKHANICRLLDFGVTQSGLPYLIMDWIDGESLNDFISKNGRLSPRDATLIFKQIAAGLGLAHRNKIVHRDLKPENVMLTKSAEGFFEVQIVDFGVAKLIGDGNADKSIGPTKAGFTVGTPKYMSPEQISTGDLDYRSDLYSLGCVMYFTLTGSPPFSDGTVLEILKKHLSEATPPFDPVLEVPAELQNIVFRAMQKRPEERFANTDELILELDRFISVKSSIGEAEEILLQVIPDLIESTVQSRVTETLRASRAKRMPAIVWFLLAFFGILGISMLLQRLLE